MSDQTLLIEPTERGVALLRLNRPERRNALSQTLVNALSDTLSVLMTDASVRAVVVTGEGKAFCSGMDLREANVTADRSSSSVNALRGFADLIVQIHHCPKPIIVALNGDALAGGAGLAVACDFIIAAESASLGYPEVRWGMVASIVMDDLVKSIGDRRARQLLLTGRPISATEAEHIGLINRVVPADRCLVEAMELARSMSDVAPMAVATTKELLDETVGRPHDLRGAAAISAVVRDSEEAQEGIKAFLERRPPRWAPPAG